MTNNEEKILEEIPALYNKFGSRRDRWKKGKNPHITAISLQAITLDIEIIEIFVKYGYYQNRSVAIKHYMREGLDKDLENLKKRADLKNE